MQPLMPFFLGLEDPPAPLLTTVQKVFRTPDIDEVGLDTFHLTFFEMLGNFSFGQYFKEGAIDLAWEFMFEHMKLDFDRIWVTVFAGDPELGLDEDEVAIGLWERKGMPPERNVRLPRADNFWSVGGPGPCGPDSEMFFDWGPEAGCGRADCLGPACECERFLEFWNLVFMEFELHTDGSLTPLPKQNIDTGMGLERAARILQQVDSVYDTDGYQRIMSWIAGESGVAYGDSAEATKAHRILADHGRGLTFLASEGVVPSNEGRGYVMRRIARRAVQQAGRIGLDSPFLAGLADGALEPREDGLFDAKLHESPFYAEGGGQVSDVGWIEHEETGARAELERATRVGDDQVLTFRGEGFAVGDRVRAVVPWSHRFPTMANHTATHLLHQALRDVLGDHVRQAGSAVRPDKLRFDFTHTEAMTAEQRHEVAHRVNEQVFLNTPVHVYETPIEEARKLGA